MFVDRNPVDKYAIETLQILDKKTIVSLASDQAMLARNRRVVERDGVCRVPSYIYLFVGQCEYSAFHFSGNGDKTWVHKRQGLNQIKAGSISAKAYSKCLPVSKKNVPEL